MGLVYNSEERAKCQQTEWMLSLKWKIIRLGYRGMSANWRDECRLELRRDVARHEQRFEIGMTWVDKWCDLNFGKRFAWKGWSIMSSGNLRWQAISLCKHRCCSATSCRLQYKLLNDGLGRGLDRREVLNFQGLALGLLDWGIIWFDVGNRWMLPRAGGCYRLMLEMARLGPWLVLETG